MDTKQRKKALRRIKKLKDGDIRPSKLHRTLDIEITYDALDIPNVLKFTKEDQKLFLKSHDIMPSHPKESAVILESMLPNYPDHPRVLSNLATSYQLSQDEEKAYEIAKRNFEKNKFYPFARITYANSCLSRNEFEKIPEIFENKFVLSLVFPERQVFHVSEVISFCQIMVKYFEFLGNDKVVEINQGIINELNPRGPFDALLSQIQLGMRLKTTKHLNI